MEQPNKTNPDDLMHRFRGRNLKSIIIFTVVVHIVVIGGTSIPFMIRSLTGPNTDKMTEEERIELAVKEARTSLQKIAEEHGIRPQKLSDQFKGAARPATEPETDAEEPAEEPDANPEVTGEEEAPKSEIEKELEKVETGPSLPPVEEAVDLFE